MGREKHEPKKYLTGEEIMAKVAKVRIEKKYGSVAKAITEVCGTKELKEAENARLDNSL